MGTAGVTLEQDPHVKGQGKTGILVEAHIK